MSNIRHSTEANIGSEIASNHFAHLYFGCTASRSWLLERGYLWTNVRLLNYCCNRRYIFQKTSSFLFKQICYCNYSHAKNSLHSPNVWRNHWAVLATWYKKMFNSFYNKCFNFLILEFRKSTCVIAYCNFEPFLVNL